MWWDSTFPVHTQDREKALIKTALTGLYVYNQSLLFVYLQSRHLGCTMRIRGCLLWFATNTHEKDKMVLDLLRSRKLCEWKAVKSVTYCWWEGEKEQKSSCGGEKWWSHVALTTCLLGEWRAARLLRDIYLNKVLSSLSDKRVICKHPTHCVRTKLWLRCPTAVISQIWRALKPSEHRQMWL